MDGNKFDGMRQWTCENGHVLGMTQRVKFDENDEKLKYSRLILYRQAIDLEVERLQEVDVMAIVEGTTLDIRCSICQAVRTWWMGADAMKRLMAKRGLDAEEKEPYNPSITE